MNSDQINPTIDQSRRELFDKINAAKYTTKENLILLVIVIITLFSHLIFTMALHIVPE